MYDELHTFHDYLNAVSSPTLDVIITSLLRQNDVILTFLRQNDVVWT